MVRMQPKELEFIRVEEQALFGSLELEDMKKAVDGQHRLAGDRVESLLPVQGEKVDMWYDVQNVREVSESKDRSADLDLRKPS